MQARTKVFPQTKQEMEYWKMGTMMPMNNLLHLVYLVIAICLVTWLGISDILLEMWGGAFLPTPI